MFLKITSRNVLVVQRYVRSMSTRGRADYLIPSAKRLIFEQNTSKLQTDIDVICLLMLRVLEKPCHAIIQWARLRDFGHKGTCYVT